MTMSKYNTKLVFFYSQYEKFIPTTYNRLGILDDIMI